MTLRLITSVHTTARTAVVYYTWQCWNCHRAFRIPKRTFFQLRARVLKGVQCRKCLKPPRGGAVVAA